MPVRHIAICLLLGAACLMAAPTAGAATPPQLQVAGNQLIDAATGETFVPRGANWPSFEYACIYQYGYSSEAEPNAVHPTAASAALIASWHINTIRIGLNQDCWLGDDGMPNFGTVAGYRDAVQQWVSILHREGLAVVLDLHWSGPNGVVAEGQRAMADDRSDSFWSSVARTFKDDGAVMFEAFNEPYSRTADDGTTIFDLTWACWRNGGCNAPRVNDAQPFDGTTFATLGMRQLVEAIRATGAKQPILLGGRDYANDLSEWLQNRPADDQLVAAFHNYNTQACNTRACWDATIAPLAAQVPVVTSEFGAVDCAETHPRNVMDWADTRGVGYLMWAWWVLPDEPQCEKLAILADVGGTPRAPNGTALKAHLDALAARQNPAQPGVSGARARRLVLGGNTRQRLDNAVELTVACRRAACRVRAGGTLIVTTPTGRRRATRRTYALRPATASLAAGERTTLALRLSARSLAAAARGLLRRGSAVATITVNAAGTEAQRRVALLVPR